MCMRPSHENADYHVVTLPCISSTGYGSKGDLVAAEWLGSYTPFEDPLVPLRERRSTKTRGKEPRGGIAKAVIERVPCNVCGIDEDALVSAWVPGPFHGWFDTARSREHHTLKETVITINPDNGDSTRDDNYPPCTLYGTRRL